MCEPVSGLLFVGIGMLTFTDASKQFWKYHNEDVLKKYQDRLKIGELKEEAKL